MAESVTAFWDRGLCRSVRSFSYWRAAAMTGGLRLSGRSAGIPRSRSPRSPCLTLSVSYERLRRSLLVGREGSEWYHAGNLNSRECTTTSHGGMRGTARGRKARPGHHSRWNTHCANSALLPPALRATWAACSTARLLDRPGDTSPHVGGGN